VSSLLDSSLWDVPVAVVDTETTGLASANGDRLVEVAVVRLSSLRNPQPEVYSQLVNPDVDMPPRAEEIHGISNKMLASEPAFVDVLPDIRTALEGAVFVAHNAPFDLGFLRAECGRAGADPVDVGPILDTLKVARNLFGFPSCGLKALSERMAIDLSNHHRAGADAVATLGVLLKMLRAVDPGKELTVGDLLALTDDMTRKGSKRTQMKDVLLQAARNNQTLEIDYTSINGTGDLKTTRTITVSALKAPNIEAWCHLREEQRVFRLDRIQRVRLLSDPV